MDLDKIDLKKLSEIFNPFENNIWVKCNSPITREEITDYINRNELQAPDIEVEMDLIWDISSKETHIKRIAWLVLNFDSNYPIEIDFGMRQFCPSSISIEDGNHRLLAAYFLDKEFIFSSSAGDLDLIEEYSFKD